MTSGTYRFDRFLFDPADRQLRRDDVPVELNARYLDALALLVRDAGKLVPKDRFLSEVWSGVPVTDEALTQCIKTLRRQLGDDAASPRFIETVPKHGYRFIAPIEREEGQVIAGLHDDRVAPAPNYLAILGGWGTVGGAAAGLIGGLLYGFVGAGQPAESGMGSISVLLVVACISMIVALIGGVGVAFGIAAAIPSGRPSPKMILGGALGGLLVGALVKLVAVDGFSLLLGQSPGDITGASEGALLGAAVGLAAWLVIRFADSVPLRRSIALTILIGGSAGVLASLLGGRLMAGSLVAVTASFPGSRLTLDAIGGSLGESGFGPLAQSVTAGLEGALFAACIVGAMALARRRIG